MHGLPDVTINLKAPRPCRLHNILHGTHSQLKPQAALRKLNPAAYG